MPRLVGVLELLVASFAAYQIPPFSLKPFDNVCTIHSV